MHGELPEGEQTVPYATLSGALWFVYYGMVMGQIDADSFTDLRLLYGVFIIASFIMIIVLLNMLIAIMGNTFAERMPLAAQIQTEDRLEFIIENWHYKNSVKRRFQPYGIVAFASDLE